jgi:predicted ABC-type ATPase
LAESELFGRDPLVGGVGTVMTHGAPAGAGRMVLRERNRLVEAKAEFAFESTLSGLHYAKRLKEWKNQGYLIEIVYVRLVSPQLALSRIARRVRQGGHGAPRADVIRRFKRGGPIFLVCINPWRNHWANT